MSDEPGHHPMVPPPPRFVPRWFFVRRMQSLVFCAALLLGLGLAIGVMVVVILGTTGERVFSPLADWTLDRRHAPSTAIMTDKTLIRNIHVNSRHPWRVSFQFTSPDGATIEGVGYTFDPSFAHTAVGQEIDVEYDLDNPRIARPLGGGVACTPPWLFLVLVAVVGPPPVAGASLLAVLWFRVRQERTLLTYGVGVPARVASVAPVSYIHVGRSPYDVYYRFRDHNGRDVIGKDRTYHYAWAEQLKPGDMVGVVYNPRSPTVNALWFHGDAAGSPR